MEYHPGHKVQGTMAKIDPEQERERLASRYAAMSDLELRRVGAEPARFADRVGTQRLQ